MTLLLNPTFILTSAFMAFVLQVMRNFWFDVPLLTNVTSTETETEAVITRNLNILQSHPRCGLTFDKGREECWWGCDRKTGTDGLIYFTVIFSFETQLAIIKFRRIFSLYIQSFSLVAVSCLASQVKGSNTVGSRQNGASS